MRKQPEKALIPETVSEQDREANSANHGRPAGYRNRSAAVHTTGYAAPHLHLAPASVVNRAPSSRSAGSRCGIFAHAFRGNFADTFCGSGLLRR